MEELQKLSLSSLCCTLLTGYCIEEIKVEYSARPDVATRIWITIEFTINGAKKYVSASHPDLVKKILIETIERVI